MAQLQTLSGTLGALGASRAVSGGSIILPGDIAGWRFGVTTKVVGNVRTGAAGESQAANGNTVSEFRDRSGNNSNAVQETGSKQPILVVDGSDRYIQFNGGDDALLADFTGDTLPQPCSIFVTGKFDALTQNAMIDGAFGTDCAFYVQADATRFDAFAGGAALQGPPADTNRHTWLIVLDGANSYIRMDGGAKFAGNPGTNGYPGITIGNSKGQAAAITGHVCEVNAYAGVVSDADADGYFAYAAAEW